MDLRRASQLVLLREICIPQVTFLLHTVLNSTGQTRKVSGRHNTHHTHHHTHTLTPTHTHTYTHTHTHTHTQCLRLADIVASEQHQLYKVCSSVCLWLSLAYVIRCLEAMSWTVCSASSNKLPSLHWGTNSMI